MTMPGQFAWQRPVQIYNTEAGTIPPWGCVRITGQEVTGTGTVSYQVAQPNAVGHQGFHLLNGPNQIAGTSYGVAYIGFPALAAFETDTFSAAGESWGPIASSYYLRKKSAGYRAIGNPATGLLLVTEALFLFGVGTLDADLGTGSSANVSFYDDSGDSGYNILCYDANPALIPASKEIVSGTTVTFGWSPCHRRYQLISSGVCETTA